MFIVLICLLLLNLKTSFTYAQDSNECTFDADCSEGYFCNSGICEIEKTVNLRELTTGSPAYTQPTATTTPYSSPAYVAPTATATPYSSPAYVAPTATATPYSSPINTIDEVCTLVDTGISTPNIDATVLSREIKALKSGKTSRKVKSFKEENGYKLVEIYNSKSSKTSFVKLKCGIDKTCEIGKDWTCSDSGCEECKEIIVRGKTVKACVLKSFAECSTDNGIIYTETGGTKPAYCTDRSKACVVKKGPLTFDEPFDPPTVSCKCEKQCDPPCGPCEICEVLPGEDKGSCWLRPGANCSHEGISGDCDGLGANNYCYAKSCRCGKPPIEKPASPKPDPGLPLCGNSGPACNGTCKNGKTCQPTVVEGEGAVIIGGGGGGGYFGGGGWGGGGGGFWWSTGSGGKPAKKACICR